MFQLQDGIIDKSDGEGVDNIVLKLIRNTNTYLMSKVFSKITG